MPEWNPNYKEWKADQLKERVSKSNFSAGLDNLPDWWNELHENGLKALSAEWQPLAELKKKLGCKAFIIMRDLCSIGKAETKDELYIHGGQECGRVYYRMVG